MKKEKFEVVKAFSSPTVKRILFLVSSPNRQEVCTWSISLIGQPGWILFSYFFAFFAPSNVTEAKKELGYHPAIMTSYTLGKKTLIYHAALTLKTTIIPTENNLHFSLQYGVIEGAQAAT